MILAYTLSMPRCTSWNGRWSGEDRAHVKLVAYRGAKGGAKAATILASQPYHYSWSDGWGAMINVREVNAKEAASLRKKSAGFCGYDWMVSTIERYGKPLADHEIPTTAAAEEKATPCPDPQ